LNTTLSSVCLQSAHNLNFVSLYNHLLYADLYMM